MSRTESAAAGDSGQLRIVSLHADDGVPPPLSAAGLAALHATSSVESLCRLFGTVLRKANFSDKISLLKCRPDAARMDLVFSTEILPELWPDMTFGTSDPLFANIASGDYFCAPGMPPLEVKWRDRSVPVFVMAPLRSAQGDTPAGCLLVHGSHSAPVENWNMARPALTHFELALERLYRIEETRRGGSRNDEALMAMNEMGALMGTLDLPILLTKILELTLRLSGADVGSLVLRTKDGGIESRVEWGLSRGDALSIRRQDGESLVEACMRTGEAEYIQNVYLDPRLDTGAGSLPLDSIIVLPLTTGNGTLGAINVVNVSEQSGFNEARLSTVITISTLAAIAVENARYHEEALENEKLKEQARIAERIQTGFFPKQVPELPGLELAGKTAPAQFVGGDYYDFIDFGDGRLGVAVGDVSGHGISSGLVMTMTRTLFRAAAQTGAAPGELLATLNNHLASDNLNGAFVTFMYAVLDASTGRVCMASAGHTPLVHHRAGDGSFAEIGPEGLPLGLFEGAEYAEETFFVAPGDRLLLLTDGIVEAMSPGREPFGDDRLKKFLADLGDRPANETLDALHDQVLDFTSPDLPHDDLTTVLIRVFPRPA